MTYTSSCKCLFYSYYIIYIYIYIYMYIINHECNVPPPVITKMAFWQLMHFGTLQFHRIMVSWNCTSHAQLHDELQESHLADNQEGALFSWLHVYYVHLASVRFQHLVCCGSLMIYYYQWCIQRFFGETDFSRVWGTRQQSSKKLQGFSTLKALTFD